MEMRYYDLIETPLTGKIYLTDGENCIIETDERVYCWFQQLPAGYQRAYDVDGYPFNELIPPYMPTLDDYKSKLSSIRATAQSAGVSVDGVLINTNATSRFEMGQYVTESIINGLVDVEWELEDGTYHLYTVQELKPVYKCVVNYVADCFRRSKVLMLELDEAVDPSTVVLTTGWPDKVLTTV